MTTKTKTAATQPTVTHAPATRLESGEILATPEDHEIHEITLAEEVEIHMSELEEQAHG